MFAAAPIADAIRETARGFEFDRYLAALLAPAAARGDLAAVAAFSGELVRVRDTVTNPMIGEIRLQWWRDALQQVARGDVIGHPVADALGATIRRHSLPLALLEDVIDARSRDIARQPPADDAELATYLFQSEGALFEAALIILGVPTGSRAREAARPAGQTYGLARLLGGLPQALARGYLPLPVSRLEAAGIPAAALELVRVNPDLPDLVRGLRQEARQALIEAREQTARLGRLAVPAFLPLVMVEPYLQGQEQTGADLSTPAMEIAPIRRVWRFWRAKRRGQV